MHNARDVAADAPLLLFDSGIGGLSVLRKVRALLPTAPIVYVADYAGLPYGEKSELEIAARVPAILGRLAERYRPSLITIACNTASTIALPAVRAALELPIVGTVPAVKPAGLLSKSRVIGLLGTAATIRQPYVDNLAAEFAADARLLRFGAGELVHAAEAEMRGESVDPAVFDRAIAGLTDQPGGAEMDVIILACTHFPLVEPALRAALERRGMHGVTFVDGSDGIARRIAFLSEGRAWPKSAPDGVFVTTGAVEAMADYAPALARHGLIRINSL